MELYDQRNELEDKHELDQIKEGFKKLSSRSPFYYAIKNKMQGNIYLLLEKGLDLYSALCESIIHNRYNFFISVCESIGTKDIQKKVTTEGKNLLHILAENYSNRDTDEELFDEAYSL
eukprot:CAMPEP_0205816638 /NCGR_PEP_ID=MMETSP0205-20121125/23063_1 /ASSEMBLY_ACC=CAM_ASM_000278 /TAXON_ID=36767 /ORGANISM="Euplotes focardii, Strain TN1" /LENGTH=117 /DNA_ID=CAMNT_0053105459 /DNA_START=395 /DNA_END=744 /DNA_ORIENTATION=-